MKQPVAVVMVTWNSANDIEASLRTVMAEHPAEVVVIDNASEDDTVKRIRNAFPDVKLLLQSKNGGFAKGCNIGITHSSARYVLFLNDDARLEPGYLATLVQRLESDPHAASAVGKLVFKQDGERHIDSAGISMCWHALRPDDRGFGEIDRGQFDQPEKIFGPTGAAALYRRAAVEEVGPQSFDEDLFAYYEDVDLAWRLRRKGWHHLYVPAAVCLHRRRGPHGKPSAIAGRAFVNRYIVWLKNESPWRFATYAPVAIPWEIARIAKRAVSLPASLKGLPQVWSRAKNTWRKRLRTNF